MLKLFNSKIGVRQGDVLSPNLFKLYIHDFPKYLQDLPGIIFLNDIPLHCLMYADAIVILSSSREGLQRRLDKLESFCKDWCLDVNIDKTKVLIFNKTSKLMKDEFKFDNKTLECVKHYRYLGVYLRSPYLIIISAICHCHSFKNELVLVLNTAWRKQPIADYVSNHNRTCGESVSENSE